MSQKESAYTVAKALYWVQTLEPNLACHLYLDFRSIWYFLPHKVQAALMQGVEEQLLLFDGEMPNHYAYIWNREIDIGAREASYYRGVPDLTLTGHRLITDTFGLPRRRNRKGRIVNGIPTMSKPKTLDLTSWFVEDWDAIKSYGKESMGLTAAFGNESRGIMNRKYEHAAYVIEGGGDFEDYFTKSGEYLIGEDLSNDDIFNLVSKEMGVHRVFIEDKEDIFFLGRSSEETTWEEMSSSELVTVYDPPFAYCRWDDDKHQYKCSKVTGGTGTQLDIEDLSEDAHLKWPDPVHPNPLPLITSRHDLAVKIEEMSRPGFVSQFDTDIINTTRHHEIGNLVFEHLDLTDEDIIGVSEYFLPWWYRK